MISDADSKRLRDFIIGVDPPAPPSLFELFNMTRTEAIARGLDVYRLWKQHGCFMPEYAAPPSGTPDDPYPETRKWAEQHGA